MGPELYTPRMLPGPRYECGGDHWVKHCSNLKQELKLIPKIPPLMRGCKDCGVKHLIPDCPKLQEQKNTVTLYCVEALPSSNPASSSDFREAVPLKAIMRAQAKDKNDALNENKTKPTPSEKSRKTKETWKARRARRAAHKKRKE